MLRLMTEEQVLRLVEKSEELWDKALESRKRANELTIEAETLGLQVESLASDATTSLKGASISEESLKEATDVQNKSIDLGSLLQKAVEASKEADEIEALAEEALAVAEAGLEQHLKDFPEAD